MTAGTMTRLKFDKISIGIFLRTYQYLVEKMFVMKLIQFAMFEVGVCLARS